MPFDVKVQQRGGLTVLRLCGELDVQPAPNLRALFDALVEDQHVRVVVDLRQLTFCDSVGLSALIHGYNACENAGGSLRVVCDTGLVRRLLHVTGVHRVLSGQPELGDPIAGQ